MTLEFDPNHLASPEDLFGPSSTILRTFSGLERLVRVSENIDEVREATIARGYKLTEIWRDSHIVHKEGQTLAQAPLGFFTDRVNGYVWVATQEYPNYVEMFGEGAVG